MFVSTRVYIYVCSRCVYAYVHLTVYKKFEIRTLLCTEKTTRKKLDYMYLI